MTRRKRSANALATATTTTSAKVTARAGADGVEARVEGKRRVAGPARPARGRRGPRSAPTNGRLRAARPGEPGAEAGAPRAAPGRTRRPRRPPAGRISARASAASAQPGMRLRPSSMWALGPCDRRPSATSSAPIGRLDRAPEGVDRSAARGRRAGRRRPPAGARRRTRSRPRRCPSAISGACSPSPDGIARRASCVKARLLVGASGRPASRPPARR